MQSARKCTMCATRATGVLLQSRTDVLLLRTNMAALRRGAVCLGFLRYVLRTKTESTIKEVLNRLELLTI